MTRSIKKVAHDLLPLSEAVLELGAIISQMLLAVKPLAKFSDTSAVKYFEESMHALDKLTLSATLIKEYIYEIDNEADKVGISKD